MQQRLTFAQYNDGNSCPLQFGRSTFAITRNWWFKTIFFHFQQQNTRRSCTPKSKQLSVTLQTTEAHP